MDRPALMAEVSVESRDLHFDLSPSERRLAEAREIAADPTAPYEVWRQAYLLVQEATIRGEVPACATSTSVGETADGCLSE